MFLNKCMKNQSELLEGLVEKVMNLLVSCAGVDYEPLLTLAKKLVFQT